MLIANPIYDAVFKFLLEDNKIAKLLLSDLLQLEILDLEYKPQEYVYEKEKGILTLYRVDFNARIKDSKGKERVVLIEIQKTKFLTDLMRFRNYLGNQYSNPENVKIDKDGLETPLPIITVYLLGYSLSYEAAILYIKPKILERGKNQELNINERFIESLTHDTIIVQIPVIRKKNIKDDLEKIFGLFNPESKIHELSIKEEDYPEKYRPVIRRLSLAVADAEVKKRMKVEDQMLSEIEAQKKRVQEAEKIAEEAEKIAKEAKKNAKEAEKNAKEAVKNAKEAVKQLEKEKLKAELERKEKEEAKRKLAKFMKDIGKPIEEIANETGLSQNDILNL